MFAVLSERAPGVMFEMLLQSHVDQVPNRAWLFASARGTLLLSGHQPLTLALEDEWVR